MYLATVYSSTIIDNKLMDVSHKFFVSKEDIIKFVTQNPRCAFEIVPEWKEPEEKVPLTRKEREAEPKELIPLSRSLDEGDNDH